MRSSPSSSTPSTADPSDLYSEIATWFDGWTCTGLFEHDLEGHGQAA